jgi:hypothetical protein
MAEKKAIEKKDKPMKGDKMADEGNAFGDAVRKAKADGIQKGETIKVGGNTYPVKESTEIDRMRELTGRLNRSEKPALVENREVDQIRALTQRLLG